MSLASTSRLRVIGFIERQSIGSLLTGGERGLQFGGGRLRFRGLRPGGFQIGEQLLHLRFGGG